MTAPLLVIAVGNRSRGDDALGPALLDGLRDDAAIGVDLLEEFQLQVEHALDLVGRRGVLFVDASRAPVARLICSCRRPSEVAITAREAEKDLGGPKPTRGSRAR